MPGFPSFPLGPGGPGTPGGPYVYINTETVSYVTQLAVRISDVPAEVEVTNSPFHLSLPEPL